MNLVYENIGSAIKKKTNYFNQIWLKKILIY